MDRWIESKWHKIYVPMDREFEFKSIEVRDHRYMKYLIQDIRNDKTLPDDIKMLTNELCDNIEQLLQEIYGVADGYSLNPEYKQHIELNTRNERIFEKEEE